MNRKLLFSFVLIACTFAVTPSLVGAELSAREIMQNVDDRDDGESFVADYTMVLIDRRDRQRTRNLRIYSKDQGADTLSLSQFETPADIRGTSYLNHDWEDPDRDDDSWLYLPALQRVKRIASSDTADSFLGSDFTYSDINGLELDWFDYSFVSESEMIDGHDTWQIEITPKSEMKDRAEDATGYSKMHVWIRKDNFVQLRAQAWELRANRVKYFNSTEIDVVDGIWTTHRLQAVTTRNGRQEHASVLQLNNIEYNTDVADDLFTTESMQRGLD